MNEFQNTMRVKMLGISNKYGVDVAVDVARRSLKKNSKEYTAEFKTKFNGEVCEAVLELLLRDWVRKMGVDGVIARSLVLRDLQSKNKEFLTEIDMALFTPWCIYCIECKSYSGEKQLVGKGTLRSDKGHEFDVYDQDIMHLRTLDSWVGRFSSKPNYRMLLFNFSNGHIEDKRSEEYKKQFPLANEKDLFRHIRKGSHNVWDMDGLRRAVPKMEAFSDRNREKHLKYVRSLHG